MNISVCQRIVLTIAIILALFLVTSVLSFFSFNSVSNQVNAIIKESSPRVYISSDLKAYFADTKYTLLSYVSAKSSEATAEVAAKLDSLNSTFQQEFERLETIEGQTEALMTMQKVTADIFKLSENIITERSHYWDEQANIEAQTKEYKYLSEEIIFTLDDLLYEEFRFEFLKVVKPLKDEVAYLVGIVKSLLDTQDPEEIKTQKATVDKYLASINEHIEQVKAIDEDAYESIIDIWLPYQQQLKESGYMLPAHLESIAALQRSENVLMDIEQLVQQNDTLINEFIQRAKQQAAQAESVSNDVVSRGKFLIEAGTALAAFISVLFGYRLVSHLQASFTRVVTGMKQIASGNLTNKIDVIGKDELADLSENTNQLSEDLRHMVVQVINTVHEMQNTAKTSSDISRATLEAVEKQSSQSSRLATTAAQVETSAREVAQHAEQTLNDTLEAENILDSSNQLLASNSTAISVLADEVNYSMAEVDKLKQHSDSISEVINVIKAIAEQTNLLALNAAIEAARAGETGRGFSVVADEVRSLANRTQGSISDIENMVTNLQSGAEKTATVMSRCAEDAIKYSDQLGSSTDELTKVSDAVQRMKEMSAQVANATEEQSATVSDISQSINEINHITVTTTEGAEKASGQSQALLELSDNLAGLVTRFKV